MLIFYKQETSQTVKSSVAGDYYFIYGRRILLTGLNAIDRLTVLSLPLI